MNFNCNKKDVKIVYGFGKENHTFYKLIMYCDPRRLLLKILLVTLLLKILLVTILLKILLVTLQLKILLVAYQELHYFLLLTSLMFEI